jgi:DNA-directed RNA polymerase subunit RPC12/RpoP
MNITCRCARCGTRIPVAAEMVGQTVLCPYCMERVYVTEASPESSETTSTAGSPPPLTNLDQAAEILRRHQQAAASASEVPVGLIIGTACAAILVVALVALMVARSRSPETSGDAQKAVAVVPSPFPAAPPDNAAGSPAPPPDASSSPALPAPSPPPQMPEYPAAPPTGNPTGLGQRGAVPPAAPNVTPGSAVLSASGGRWAEPWSLPPVSMREPVVIVSLENTPTPWAALARAADTDPRWPSNLMLEADSQPQAWFLVYSAVAPGSQVHEKLARVWREEGDLRFAWVVPPIAALGPQQLANCLLDVHTGTTRKVIQLREPQTMAPVVLELNRPKQIVPLTIPHPPRPERMCLEIVALDGFPAQAHLRGGIRVASAVVPPGSAPAIASPMLPRPPIVAVPVPALPPGMVPAAPAMGAVAAPPTTTVLVVESEEYPGVEVRVRLSAAAPERPELWVETVYRDVADVEFPLTLAELERQEAEAKKTLPTAEAALAKARATIKRFEDREETLQKNKATLKRNLELAEVQRNLAASKAEEAKRLKQIEAAKAILESGDKLRKLIQQLDKQASIQFAVYLEAGDPDLLLATTVKNP